MYTNWVKCWIEVSAGGKMMEMELDSPIRGANNGGPMLIGKLSLPGGNIPPTNQVWCLKLATFELHIMDQGGKGVGMVGGGLRFGETASIPSLAILSAAGLTNRGIEPMSTSGTGDGRIKNTTGMGFSFPLVTWRLSRTKPHGSTTQTISGE